MSVTQHKSDEGDGSSWYSWYIVVLCMVAYIFSFIDRQIITLLIEPIRADLNISDTQFSLLHGFAFAMLYAIAGIPIARLADNKSRPVIISVGIFVWSFATALCGMVNNFIQLFLARMLVGVGEAALSPAAYSMISDSFQKSKLGFAIGVYSSGAFLGGGLAFIIGGASIALIEQWGTLTLPVLGEIQPWQMTFFIVGLPGLFIAALFCITIKDPLRKGKVSGGKVFTFGEVLQYIVRNKATFTAHYMGFGMMALTLMAMMNWAPAYLLRKYDMPISEVGFYLGLVVLFGNSAGVLSSGMLTDYFTRRGYRDAALRAALVGSSGIIIPAFLFPHIEEFAYSLTMLALAMYFSSFQLSSGATALQCMAPNQMRAQVTALFFLSMNIFGIMLGTTSVALLTDKVFEDDMKVGYSMSIVAVIGAVLASALLAWGLKHYSLTQEQLNDAA